MEKKDVELSMDKDRVMFVLGALREFMQNPPGDVAGV